MMQHQHEHIRASHEKIAYLNQHAEPLCMNSSCGYKLLLSQILQDISQIDHVKQLLLSKIFKSSKQSSVKHSAAPIPILTPKLNQHMQKSQTQSSLEQIPNQTAIVRQKHLEKHHPSHSDIGNLIKGIKSRTKGSQQIVHHDKKENQNEKIISLLSDQEQSNEESSNSSRSKSKEKKGKPKKLNKIIKKEQKENNQKKPKPQSSPQPQYSIASSTSTSKQTPSTVTKQNQKQTPIPKFHHIIMNQHKTPISNFVYQPKDKTRPSIRPTKMSDKQLEEWFESAFPQKPYSYVLSHKFIQNLKHYYIYCQREYKWFSIKDIENIDEGNTVKDYERSLARYA